MVGAGNSDRDGAEVGGARSSTRMLSACESEENSLKKIQTGKIRGGGVRELARIVPGQSGGQMDCNRPR